MAPNPPLSESPSPFSRAAAKNPLLQEPISQPRTRAHPTLPTPLKSTASLKPTAPINSTSSSRSSISPPPPSSLNQMSDSTLRPVTATEATPECELFWGGKDGKKMTRKEFRMISMQNDLNSAVSRDWNSEESRFYRDMAFGKIPRSFEREIEKDVGQGVQDGIDMKGKAGRHGTGIGGKELEGTREDAGIDTRKKQFKILRTHKIEESYPTEADWDRHFSGQAFRVPIPDSHPISRPISSRPNPSDQAPQDDNSDCIQDMSTVLLEDSDSDWEIIGKIAPWDKEDIPDLSFKDRMAWRFLKGQRGLSGLERDYYDNWRPSQIARLREE